jgi:hydrogenase maturation protein HypF
VSNDSRGVTIDAFGPPDRLDALLEALRTSPPPAARLLDVTCSALPDEPVRGFAIAGSEAGAHRRVSIPPDLATCDDCLRELVDSSDRRYRYPFTNCTNCGPRFTITRDVPYDRPATTMAAFEMCEACRGEYETPGDRRFHAEPNACPMCGPRVWLASTSGEPIDSTDPIDAAADAIRTGLIVGLKGLGGFHLACDASSSAAVVRLRERKRRDEKPFAVMVADVPAAERIAHLEDADRVLMTGTERPVVLVPRLAEAALAPEVAPNNPLVGLMLPYTPLHHLLARAVARPVVMTSGNLSEEPLAFRNDEAVERLGGIADLLLLHDRAIETPCDDSVARVIAGHPALLRRSRGFVPRPIRLRRPVARPILACGALLKNTFCLAAGDEAWMGPHVGDLDNLVTLQAFEAAVGRLERFLQIRPEIVAHDLHPEYTSTAYALARPGVMPVAVQHHHAHVAAVMAEHQLEGPVLGLAYDGTGYGTDGEAWGGEVLIAHAGGFDRIATFRPLRLAGGDAAVRRVWRLALAALLDAFDGAPPLDRLAVFGALEPQQVTVVTQMIEGGVQAPLAHGVGRYFDVFGALALGRTESCFEGQVALDLNSVADPTHTGAYPILLDTTLTPWQIDPRPAAREAVADLLAGVSPATISARFHNGLVAASAAAVRAAAARHGRLPVALSGGCFQNPLLAERLRDALAPDFDVYLHEQVPPGDGGIALGQALVADDTLRTT